MKTERPIVGFLRKTKELLTNNWGLKLLALILAIIIYYSLKTDEGYSTAPYYDNDRQLFHQ